MMVPLVFGSLCGILTNLNKLWKTFGALGLLFGVAGMLGKYSGGRRGIWWLLSGALEKA